MAESSVIVFTGENKGKTEAALGLAMRALGADFRVLFVQFIKAWEVSEDKTLGVLTEAFNGKLVAVKGGKGFFDAENLSANGISDEEHKKAANETYEALLLETQSGNFDLVIADEINNAVHDGLLTKAQLKALISTRNNSTHLCLTGRNFPKDLLPLVNYATDMQKLKHPYDNGDLAIVGIDY